MFSGWLFVRYPSFYTFFLQRYDEYFDFARKMGDNIKKVAILFAGQEYFLTFAKLLKHVEITNESLKRENIKERRK